MFLSQSKFQLIGVSAGGVGFRGGRGWAAVSLQFAPVGKSPSMILEMFKPLTVSVSHNRKTQLLLGVLF